MVGDILEKQKERTKGLKNNPEWNLKFQICTTQYMPRLKRMRARRKNRPKCSNRPDLLPHVSHELWTDLD